MKTICPHQYDNILENVTQGNTFEILFRKLFLFFQHLNCDNVFIFIPIVSYPFVPKMSALSGKKSFLCVMYAITQVRLNFRLYDTLFRFFSYEHEAMWVQFKR